MAITITTQPASGLIQGCYRPIRYVVNSDNADRVNIIADIVLDGVYYITKAIPVDASGNATFDIQNNVQVYQAAKLNAATRWHLLDQGEASDNITECNSSLCSISVEFYEETADADGLLTSTWAAGGTGTGGTSSNTSYAVPIVFQHLESQSITQWLIGDSTRKFLTDAPDSQALAITDSHYLYFIVNSNAAVTAEFKSYDSTGTLIDTQSPGITPLGHPKVYCLPSGPANINAYSAGFIDSNVSYYTVQIIYTLDSTVVSELRTYQVDTSCRDDERPFYFFNQRGGWDYVMLSDGTEQTNKQDSTTFSRTLPYGFNTWDTQQDVLSGTTEESFTTYLYITEEETALWLRWLLNSPKVYTLEDGAYAPVVISGTSQVIKDPLKRYVKFAIQWRYGFGVIRQRQ